MSSERHTDNTSRRDCLDMCKRDPLLSLLFKTLGCSVVKPGLVAAAVHLAFVLVPAALISRFHPENIEFLRLFEPQGVPLLVFVYFAVLPVLWIFYAWQPIAIPRAVAGLFANGVVHEARGQDKALRVFEQSVCSSFSRGRNLALVLVASLSSLVVWLVACSPKTPPFSTFDKAWWSIEPAYFLFVYVPHAFIIIYLVLWILTRQFLAVRSFRRLFETHKTAPKAFHPDRANGLAPVGTFALRSGLLALPFAIWIALQITYPTLSGQGEMWLRFDTVALLLVYAVIVPVLLISPVWAAHVEMKSYKMQALEAEALRLRRVISDTTYTDSGKKLDLIIYLEKRYQVLDSAYETWPFNASMVRRFALVSIVPLATTVLSVLLENILTA